MVDDDIEAIAKQGLARENESREELVAQYNDDNNNTSHDKS